MAHGEENGYFYYHLFVTEENTLFFSCGLKLISNQFLKKLHFTEVG